MIKITFEITFDKKNYFRQFEKCLTLECLDFCWINNAVFATLSCQDGVNSVTFWQWDGQDITQEATISIKDQKSLLPNFAAATSQKHQIIAFSQGTYNFALATKFEVNHENLEKKSGCIWDITNTKDKYLLVLTSKGHVMYYDVREAGIQFIKCMTLQSPMQKILCEISTGFILGNNKGLKITTKSLILQLFSPLKFLFGMFYFVADF